MNCVNRATLVRSGMLVSHSEENSHIWFDALASMASGTLAARA